MDNKQFYETFDWAGFKEGALKEKVSKVLQTIPKDVHSIVDIGCGNGIITNVLHQQYDVTAVDRSAAALKFLKTKTIQASADSIPLEDASFDMVFSSEMLEHLEDEVLEKSVTEFKRLSKKYLFITVPNDENPDKLSIQCPDCQYIYNSPNHLRRFNTDDICHLFPEYQLLESFSFGKKVRYYQPSLLKLKKKFSPSSSWIPLYWMPKDKRNTSCPKCNHSFNYPYRFHPIAFLFDLLNVVSAPKKPYWLFVLLERK